MGRPNRVWGNGSAWAYLPGHPEGQVEPRPADPHGVVEVRRATQLYFSARLCCARFAATAAQPRSRSHRSCFSAGGVVTKDTKKTRGHVICASRQGLNLCVRWLETDKFDWLTCLVSVSGDRAPVGVVGNGIHRSPPALYMRASSLSFSLRTPRRRNQKDINNNHKCEPHARRAADLERASPQPLVLPVPGSEV